MDERINIFELLFDELQGTNSRIDKDVIINEFKLNYPEFQEDWNMILETLDNRHPIGWTFIPYKSEDAEYFESITEIITELERVKDVTGLNQIATLYAEKAVGKYGDFIAPIVNRILRLGIGKSLLTKTDLTPMLAKKYEGNMLHNDVYITEKLDGNRCIASYDGTQWQFTSRNGKKMNVNFDMTGLPTSFIYDGEVMSEEQTELSRQRCEAIKNCTFIHCNIQEAQLMFNKTSGLINSKGSKTGLVYTIFDIISDLQYNHRRIIINNLSTLNTSNDIRILPVLYRGTDVEKINSLLDIICKMGGEGIMLNVHNRRYERKRSDALLKYKQVQYCDMLVMDIKEGNGKYQGLCGALVCYMKTDNGKEVNCEVGTGLSDVERESWGINPDLIIGKIVEVGYHEMTQDRNNIGTKLYSLRFPRLIKVREDKNETSEY